MCCVAIITTILPSGQGGFLSTVDTMEAAKISNIVYLIFIFTPTYCDEQLGPE
jgi:hypothetical protein